MTGSSSAVTTAVLPAAGWGTRFLPATKSVPKEMLPVIDRPVLEYAIAEAAAAGITDVVVVVSGDKERLMRRHFSAVPDLEATLEAAGKDDLLAAVRASNDLAAVEFVAQTEQRGLGHAVAQAASLVGDRPFAVLLPDEVVTHELLPRMIAVHAERGASVIGLMEMAREALFAYGVPDAEAVADALVRVRSIIEKPPTGTEPSGYATIGRYVFTPEVFDALDRVEPGWGGEIQLTDAIDILAREQGVYGSVISGGRFDVGNRIGMLRAALELGLERDDVRDDVRALIADLAKRPGVL